MADESIRSAPACLANAAAQDDQEDRAAPAPTLLSVIRFRQNLAGMSVGMASDE